MPNTIIYVQKNSRFSNNRKIDSLLKSVEEFHELRFVRKPRIFIFSDTSSYLHRTVTKARFYAYPNGSLVIAPWAVKEAEEGKISLEIYVRHELSHTLLFQHMGFFAAYKYPKWLMEGIATYSAKQIGTSWYPNREDVYEAIKNGVFFPPYLYKTNREDQVSLNIENRIAFMYSEFACIVDYLIESHGKEKFILYMKSLLSGCNHDTAFENIYEIDFNTFILNFRNHVSNSDVKIREE